MLEEAITEWRQAALAEGHAEGRSTLLQRQAARRFGASAGDAFAALMAGEQDAERLTELGDLVVDCESGEELLRQGRSVLAGEG